MRNQPDAMPTCPICESPTPDGAPCPECHAEYMQRLALARYVAGQTKHQQPDHGAYRPRPQHIRAKCLSIQRGTAVINGKRVKPWSVQERIRRRARVPPPIKPEPNV